jgi:D-alanyl-lipoteichoic acid acyltransferase DltB (MBOAT superfamily)
MPLGISFYTFKAISYIVDVYRRKYPAEHHPGYYAAYISYFPDVVSGPIDRAELILPQLKAEKTFNYDQAVYGLRLMLLGFAKKLLLADALTKYVDKIFDQVTLYQGFTLVLASLLYTIQIYCDFSGYSDIAIGTSRLFGINLMENFRSPYFARSIKEFWSRWHISLSTWFRDYVYIPLGGNRVSRLRRIFNLMVTFLVSGLWHGADYTFILWGGLHGLYQVVENLIHDLRKKRKVVSLPGSRARTIRAFAETMITFLLVSFAWIFFRSDGLGDALYFLTHMFADLSVTKALTQMGLSTFNLVKLGGFIFLLGCYDYFAGKRDLLREMSRLPVLLRWGIYLSLTLLIVVLKIHNGTSQQFIYFRF